MMDAMLWKAAAVFRPSVPPVGNKAGNETLEGCEQVRSVQVTAHRSPSAQAKSCSTTETVNGTSNIPLAPLPLPPPRSFFPSTLRFLWFNNNSEQTMPEKNELDLCLLSTDLSSSDEPGIASASVEDFSKDWVTRIKDAASDLTRRRKDMGSFEDSNPGSELMTEVDSSEILDGKMVDNAAEKSELSDNKKAQNWLRRILALNRQDSKGHTTSESKEILESSRNSDCCSGCKFDGLDGCTLGSQLEVPHAKVVHDRDSFSKFLQHASLFDMRVISQMCFLCNLAYSVTDIKPAELLKYHKLMFTTSSIDMKAEIAAKAKDCKLERSSDANKFSHSGREDDRKTKVASAEKSIVTSKSSHHSNEADNLKSEKDSKGVVSMFPAVASKLATAFSSSRRPSTDGLSTSQGNANQNHQQSMVETELNTDASLMKSSEELCSGSPGERDQASFDALMANVPVTAVVVAEEQTKQAVAEDLQSLQSCPCEWFICDEPTSHTRLFVIQGSESLASWQANLFFEPTKFEGLGILVHRGIYEAAKGLYEQILPEVLNHLKSHGDQAQVRFTGHSLGGSLSSLVALMLLIRGVLPRRALLPVITFGSPCIMCGGDLLLQKLDLPPSQIQSVIMHRDIVPRAFACDYPDRVARLLKRLNGSFRNHPCLNEQSLLYAPMGQILVLQPDEKKAPAHPLLPAGSGLYAIRNLLNGDSVESATVLRAAQRAFLNTPHPLEILSDPGAYGFDGAVTRDHDSSSYLEAINMILHHELRRSRRLQRKQRRRLWWPLLLAESSVLVQNGPKCDLSARDLNSGGALSPSVAKSPLGSRHMAVQRFDFLVGRSYISRSFRERFSRYARLIASKHVRVGLLLIISVPVFVLEGISLFIVKI